MVQDLYMAFDKFKTTILLIVVIGLKWVELIENSLKSVFLNGKGMISINTIKYLQSGLSITIRYNHCCICSLTMPEYKDKLMAIEENNGFILIKK